MIQKHRIRLNSTESVNSVDKGNKVAVELKQTTKPYFFTNSIREQIDQYEVFERERNNCTKYRLITTIKPYCTNILFNPVTEIVKYEETDEPIIVTDENINGEGNLSSDNDKDLQKAIGLQRGLTRKYMVKNTEYSSENIGYTYHPGYDIFNNHLLRNLSFKIVNNSRGTNLERSIFNTIKDYAREYDGTTINFSKRTFDESNDDKINVENNRLAHLYERSDILSITDAINQRLTEENGWVGFVNQTTINAKDKESKEWYDLDFNRVINSKENCDFIDMYPDRTLYSFHPKYNKHRHRPEYNWKTYLTYPYENFYDHELIKPYNTQLNAMLIQSVEYVSGITGQDTILFKTYVKHNLNASSIINLYYLNKNGEYDTIKNVIVSDIGDLNKNNNDFYFYTTDTRILTDLNVITKGKINTTFRFKNVVNGCESEYYIRIFRKLPNLLKSREITDNDIMSKGNLDSFINNCKTYFDNETYKLGFSNTIYNDNNAQITFTDSIEIDNLLDNRGRPLSEIYTTIVKNNAGNHKWYEPKDDKFADENTEFSHCFSDVSYGFELFCEDRLSDEERIRHAKLSNVKVLHTNRTIESVTGYSMESDYINKYGWKQWVDKNEKDNNLPIIDVDNEEYFIGDMVEYNPTVCVEMTLSEGCFRFNSFLRDNPNEEKYEFEIDNINADDYDYSSDETEFSVTIPLSNPKVDLFHPEGYYYKAHYPIQLREWGEIQQGSHYDLKLRSATKVNMGNKVCVIIKTTLPHRLDISDTLLICCDNEDKIMKTTPVYVFDELTFAISDYVEYNSETKKYETVISASDICDILNNKYETITFKLRRYNNEIPHYASKTPNMNRYMWRTLNGVGNKDNVTLEEYPFANGYFYVNQDINFYLRRQDGFNKLGLYYNKENSIIPNDVFGNVLSASDYEYKDESVVTC